MTNSETVRIDGTAITYADLEYDSKTRPDGKKRDIATLPSIGNCELRVVRFEPNDEVGLHIHTGRSLSIVLHGTVEFHDKGVVKIGKPGTIHPCRAQWPYNLMAKEESYVLVIEAPGSEFKAVTQEEADARWLEEMKRKQKNRAT